jgi:hypothetical protein
MAIFGVEEGFDSLKFLGYQFSQNHPPPLFLGVENKLFSFIS